MKSLIWILGRGGFLGQHLEGECGSRLDFDVWLCPVAAFSWDNARKLREEFSEALHAFFSAVRGGACDHWTIVWAAGRGVIASDETLLRQETEAWKMLLATLGEHMHDAAFPGTIFLSSSAGALYAGVSGEATDESPVQPLSEYGRQKSEQERILGEWLAAHPNVNALIGRISSLYGEAQSVRKPQGLIAHLSRSILRKQPIHIFVPLDTIRDYHEVRDAARDIAVCLERRVRERTPQRITKIFASGRPTSIAELIGIYTKIAKYTPRIVVSPHASRSLHGTRTRLRSTVWSDLAGPVTSLPAGIHRLHQHQLKKFAQGAPA